MLFSQVKIGQRVVIMPEWGYRIGHNFHRNGLNHLPGVVSLCHSPQWVYINLDDGRRVATDARALKLMQEPWHPNYKRTTLRITD